MTSTRSVWHAALRIGLGLGLVSTSLLAQGGAAGAVGSKGDTTVAPKGIAPKAQPPKAPPPKVSPRPVTRLTPPLTPRRAFLYSAMLPGFGQSRLDRGTSGALFASIELAGLVMVRRSNAELREVKRYKFDTLPSDFTTNGTTIVKSGSITGRYTEALVKTRRLHVEDWLAALAFNHLFSGADAFVAAQLWDTPINLSAYPRADGAVFVASIRW